MAVDRRRRGRSWLRSLISMVVGYVLLILLTTLVQEGLLGGVSYRDSPLRVLVLAGILTPLAAFLAGGMTGVLAPRRPVAHAVPMAFAIVIETTVLYRTGRVDGPLWFEFMAGASLVVAALFGAWLATRARWQPKDS